MEINQSLCHFLREERIKAGLTLEQAAKNSGFSRWTIINWESGERSPRFVDLERYLTEGLQKTIQDFIDSNPTFPPAGLEALQGKNQKAGNCPVESQ